MALFHLKKKFLTSYERDGKLLEKYHDAGGEYGLEGDSKEEDDDEEE